MNRRGAALGLAVLFLLNAPGLANSLTGSAYRAGELDPLLAPLTLAVLAGVYLLSQIPARVLSEHGSLVFLGAVLGTSALLSGLFAGMLIKLVRDLIYLWILCLTVLNLSAWADARRIDLCATAHSLLIGGIVVLPLLGYLAHGLGGTGRLSGFMLSPSLFGNSIGIYLLIGYLTGVRGPWFGAATALGLLLVVASGTRTGLVLLLALAGLHIIRSVRLGRIRAAATLSTALLVGGALVVIAVLRGDLGISVDLRVLSIQDADGGSIATRLAWYQAVWTGLKSSTFIGGFGPGSSEATLGYLPHFDLLRYWFDYSVIYVFGFLLVVYRVMCGPACIRDGYRWYPRLLRALGISVVLALSMHNVFQSAGGTLLIAIFLFALRQHLMQDTQSSSGSGAVRPVARQAAADPTLRLS